MAILVGRCRQPTIPGWALATQDARIGELRQFASALAAPGMKLDFWKVTVRPGNPLMFGKIDAMRVIGLPGNPVSALVCSVVFVRPLVDAQLGRPPDDGEQPATLGADLPANGARTDYMRTASPYT